MKSSSITLWMLFATATLVTGCNSDNKDNDTTTQLVAAQVGERPLFLVRQMQDSTLIPITLNI